MSRRLDVAAVHAVLARLVEENPNRRDEHIATGHSARYVVNGAPNCLVAVVLRDLGCSIGVLRALDREGAAPGSQGTAAVMLAVSRHMWLRRFTPEARALLASVQRWQDVGCTWAKALANATAPQIQHLDQRVHGWKYQQETRPWMPLPIRKVDDA